ncbi:MULTISPECIES: RING-H2 finger protein [Sorangium]|uniref:RING-type domain-containing protein n=1 Tax=Sorangium cellulosum TaxID=56 RepID=A0A4P2QXI6_SORCE|nr:MULTISPECIES: RING-H2 finger protein [Sorangium]AUX34891.1 uncharacterized protein SOCE836_070700 [Sorangium cellulosum]WCQ94197.1 hypothetical protein NQZ70_06954 [Sorangium sp. Soce836]
MSSKAPDHFTFDSDTRCTICLEKITKRQSDDGEAWFTSCYPTPHPFHWRCLADWFDKNKKNSKCPNCNQPQDARPTATWTW